MSRRVLIGLLALSVLFNIFVLLGFARARRAAQTLPDEKVVQQVASELKLDEKQARMFGELRSATRRDTAALNENIALVRQRMLAELRSETPDLEIVRELVDEETELLRQRRQLGAESFGKFVKELSPPQRQEMMRHVPRPPRSLPPHVVKRFDADKNGVLDPAELDIAMSQSELKSRQQPRPGQPPMWQRFDIDHNGILDGDELKRMDESWRERNRPNRDR